MVVGERGGVGGVGGWGEGGAMRPANQCVHFGSGLIESGRVGSKPLRHLSDRIHPTDPSDPIRSTHSADPTDRPAPLARPNLLGYLTRPD